jgi:hypothetical protein
VKAKPGRKRKVTRAVQAKVYELRRAGLSEKQIANAVGVCRATLYTRCGPKTRGLRSRRKKR